MRVSPATRRLRWCEMLLLLLLPPLYCNWLHATSFYYGTTRGARFDPWAHLGKNASRGITVWNCCLLAAGRPLLSADCKTSMMNLWRVDSAPAARPVTTRSWFFRGCTLWCGFLKYLRYRTFRNHRIIRCSLFRNQTPKAAPRLQHKICIITMETEYYFTSTIIIFVYVLTKISVKANKIINFWMCVTGDKKYIAWESAASCTLRTICD